MDTNTISAVCLTGTCVSLLHTLSNARIIFMTSELGSTQIRSTRRPSNTKWIPYRIKRAATGVSGGKGFYPSVGALNACRLATAGKDSKPGTFSNRSVTLLW